MSRQLRHIVNAQGGQTLVIAALMAIVLFGLAAVAVDGGIAQAERRDVQAAVDQASLAGTRQYAINPGDVKAAHFVALQFVTTSLKQAMPGSCTSALDSGCSGTTFTVGTYTFTFTDGANSMDLAATHLRSTILAGVVGVQSQTVGTSARALAPGPLVLRGGYSVFAAGGSFTISGGGTSNPSGNVTGGVYANGDAGANNGPHAISIPTQQTDKNGTVCSPASLTKLDTTQANGGAYTWNQTPAGTGPTSGSASVVAPKPDPFAGFPAPTTPALTFLTTGAAKSGGVWQPGTYQGIAPNGLTMAPGVYVIKSYTGTIAPGSNATSVAPGAFNKAGAIALVVDSSDTGSLDLSAAHINGLDDDGSNPRDPLGTHNFVIYGPTFTGSTSFGSGNSGPADITGIVDIPLSSAGSNGTPHYDFYGEIVFKDFDLRGGGNAEQGFNFVCGLAAVSTTGGHNGLIR